MKKFLGKHVIAEFFNCNPEILDSIEKIKTALIEAAEAANATVLEVTFRKFTPQGVSGVVVVSESHLTIHTWPEYSFAAVDIFTCGEHTKPIQGMNKLAEALEAKDVKYLVINRGSLEEIENFLSKSVDGASSRCRVSVQSQNQKMIQSNSIQIK